MFSHFLNCTNSTKSCKASRIELASELESELRETANWGRRWLVDFGLEKLVLFLYSHGKATRYSNSLHDFSVTISGCYFLSLLAQLGSGIPCLQNAFFDL